MSIYTDDGAVTEKLDEKTTLLLSSAPQLIEKLIIEIRLLQGELSEVKNAPLVAIEERVSHLETDLKNQIESVMICYRSLKAKLEEFQSTVDGKTDLPTDGDGLAIVR